MKIIFMFKCARGAVNRVELAPHDREPPHQTPGRGTAGFAE